MIQQHFLAVRLSGLERVESKPHSSDLNYETNFIDCPSKVRRKMNWIDSAGGPLIVLPLSHLLRWEGILPPSAGRIVEATFRWNPKSGTATDYDSACDVADLIGLLNLGDLEVLVLGDEPLSTAWLPFADRPGGVIVRWHYGY